MQLESNQTKLNVLIQVQRPLATASSVETSASAKTGASAKTSSSATRSSTSSITSSFTNPTTQSRSNGLSPSDKIAIGIGVPVGVVRIFGVWITWRICDYRKKIVSKLLFTRASNPSGKSRAGTGNILSEEYLLSK